MWSKEKNREFYAIFAGGLSLLAAYLVVALFFRDFAPTNPSFSLYAIHLLFLSFFTYAIRFVKDNSGGRLIDHKFSLIALILVVVITLWMQDQYKYPRIRPVWLYFLPEALLVLVGLTTLVKLKWFSAKTE